MEQVVEYQRKTAEVARAQALEPEPDHLRKWIRRPVR
ncbi:hypothetical protein GIX45_05035 [Erwinia sp. CPCC 100877]|nr:hypothetical protein [Erwinia sp. CPCC 100877]